ncbi:MAG: EAL domain-containing protein, partial [Nautiliaceae bacterium]
YFAKMLEIPKEKIIDNLRPEELFASSEKQKAIKKIIQKRLKGEKFQKYYENEEIITPSNKRLYVKFFTKTIKYEGSFAGLVIGINVTNEIKKDSLIKILKDINHIIIFHETLNEIFYNTAKSLYSNGKFEFVCISVKEKNKLNPKYCLGNYNDKLMEFLKKHLKPSADKNICLAAKYMVENQIMLIEDIEKIDFPNRELLSILKELNFRSLVFVPIFKDKELIAAIGIASKYINDFDENIKFIFEELKKDLEFAVKKIEKEEFFKLLQEAFNKSFAWVVITDSDGKILYANKTVEELSQYSLEELKGKNPKIFKSGFHLPSFYEHLWNSIKEGKIFEGIIVNKAKDGSFFYLRDKIVPVTTPNGERYYISIATDITNEYKLKRQLKIIKENDLITGLLNRESFIKKTSELIKHNQNKKFALLIIDIKDFKLINHFYNKETGDAFLKKFAEYLNSIFFESDIIARLNADEFAVFIEYEDLSSLYKIIDRVINKLKNTKILNTETSINIGISLYPKDGKDISTLIEKALIALEIAKQKGENEFEFYNQEIHKHIEEYQQAKFLIKHALVNEEFEYFFQPYVDSKTLKTAGAESLLRIIHDGEIIPPYKFIEYAEKSALIKEIEKLMFSKYLQYLKEANFPISFNISGASLRDENHIKSLFGNVTNLPIVIELTERELAYNIEYTRKILEFFKIKAIKISIDDFGTGYSSLTYLKDLPIDFLKIDMSFIKNIENSQKDRAIVDTIIDFAHKFNIKTIAEGVENENQVKILQNLECDYLQGFYFAKPMPFEEFKKFLN